MVWVGSIFSVILMSILGTLYLSGLALYLMWFAAGLYLLAVQGPTIRFNIPLNNAVHALDVGGLDDIELAAARQAFEAPWNRWNSFRTLTSTVSVVGLLILQLVLR